jgi:hypothetical protein
MTIESSIHAALMARAETITGYTVVWPQKGADKPEGEHITAFHLPNDNQPLALGDNVFQRQGFLILTLVSPLGAYEVVSKEKAGAIAAYFPRALKLTKSGATVTITGHTVKPGQQIDTRWETPIWVSYWSIS